MVVRRVTGREGWPTGLPSRAKTADQAKAMENAKPKTQDQPAGKYIHARDTKAVAREDKKRRGEGTVVVSEWKAEEEKKGR